MTALVMSCEATRVQDATHPASISATETPGSTLLPTQTQDPTSTATTIPEPLPTEKPLPTDPAEPTPTATTVMLPQGSSAGETWVRPMDGMVMVYNPAGELLVGSSEEEIDTALQHCERDRGEGRCQREWFHDEYPDHKVRIEAFWIDRTEVTNAQFAAFLNVQGNQIEGDVTWLEVEDDSSLIEDQDGGYHPVPGYEDHPVIEVSWYGAITYCHWAGASLASEESWEYAARGPERAEFPWGNDSPSCQQANGSGCQDGPSQVNSHPDGASWTGAQDMAGNVFEWVTNWSMPYPGSPYENVDFGTIYKIVRGGSWNFEPYYGRSAHRSYAHATDIRNDFVGFRCVLTVDEEGNQ